jgi:hypothetical protein
VALDREHGFLHFLAGGLASLGAVELALGNRRRARRTMRDALEAAGEIGSVWELSNCLLLAGISVTDDSRRSARLIGAADALLDEAGGVYDAFEGDLRERAVAAIRGGLGEAAFASAYRQGRLLSPDAAVADAFAAVLE